MVAEEIDADYTPVVVAVIAAAGEVDYHTPGKSADEFADAADVEDSLLFAKHLPETESACKLQQAVDLAAIEVDVAAEIHCCSQEQEHIAAYYTVDAAVEEVEESEHY